MQSNTFAPRNSEFIDPDFGLVIVHDGFSIYDSMILASTHVAGCNVLFTEDLQDGQCIEGILTVKNSFVTK